MDIEIKSLSEKVESILGLDSPLIADEDREIG